MRRWLTFHRDLGLQLLAFYLLLIVPFLVTLLVFDRLVGERIRADVEANDIALARAIALETDISISNSLKTVEELSSYASVINIEEEKMGELFSVVLSTRPDVNLVYRLGADGIMLYHYPVGPSSTVGTDFSFRSYYQNALTSNIPLISEGRISPTTNQAVATAVMPIRSSSGEFLGLVGTNIKLESLSNTLSAIISEHANEEGFEILILDAGGQVIAHPDPSFLLRHANEILPDVYTQALEGNGGSIVEADLKNVERLYTYASIPSVDWGVVISRPTANAFATRIILQRITQVAMATFVLIGLAFWGILTWRVINPIEKLAPISEAIGLNQEIEQSQRTQIEKMSHRADQIGNLIRSILRMENSIAERMKEQATLLETSTAVVSSLDLSVVLDRILEQVGRLLNVQRIAIIALDEGHGEFRIRASRGLSQGFTEQLSIQPSEPSSVSMRALRVREPIQVSDTETDPSYKPQRARSRAEGYRAVLAVPLNTQHAPPTCLLVFHPTPHEFTNNEIQLLSSFANQATMAIENAILFERSDTRLQEQTRRLEALVQSMEDGLILSDLKGVIIYANRRVAELSRLSNEDMANIQVERVISRVLSNSIESTAKDEVRNILEGSNQKSEIALVVAGRPMHLRFETFDVTDARDMPIGRGVILHDITADRDLDRMKSNLISTVSHELRTPLAAIKGYASTLLAEDVEWDIKSQREFLTIISNETDRLTGLVNNLLDLSRIEAGSIKLSLEKCNIEETILRGAKRSRLESGNRFEVKMEADLPSLYADVPRLETVIRNLIENSVKYAGERASIQVKVNRQNDTIVFRVMDDGPGIPPEKSERIFERFYRLDDSLARVTSGAGLGLAICQGLVRAHQGEIWVEPMNAGACIAFSIPLNLYKASDDPL
ncbi:MAG: GAF domain-containing protein [Anaerolineales bacterium]|nr:GAF domain-containing protein [Anaerolineales bacterium]